MPGPPSDSAWEEHLSVSHHRLVGPERAAVRRSDRRSWLLVPRERLRRAELPLGLHIELGRKDAPRDHSLTTEPAVGSRRLPVPVPPLSPGGGALVATLVAFAAVVGFWMGFGATEASYAEAIGTFTDLGEALLAIWLTLSGLLVIEGMLVADAVQGSTHIVWFRRGIPEVEPVCWRLGIPAGVAVLALIFAVVVFTCAAGWYAEAPPFASGVAVGAVLYAIQALYPLRPGPGARVLGAFTRVQDLPTQLRWALVERFLPLRRRVDVGGTWTMAVAALALGAWAAGTGQLIYGLSEPAAEGLTLPGSLWRGAAALGFAGWAGWLVTLVGGLFLAALRVSSTAELEPLTPSPKEQKVWTRQNPLNRHVPQLKGADWRWGLAPRGTLLIEYGALDRDFYWVASGKVHVIGRTAGGDPLHLTTVAGALGIGEIALLDDVPRTADVIAAEDTVVAILSREAFEGTLNEDGIRRFRDVVLASQALARASSLWGLAPDVRARWLSAGGPRTYREGDTVIEEGADEQWVGLVVRGRLSVERDGLKVATLEPDGIFGEMAYLTLKERTATIRAEEPAMVWRWEPEWLDRELVEAGAFDELRELAEERTRVTG